METLLPWIISLVSGAVGGNAAGAVLKNMSLGTVGNSLVGILGGGVGASVLGMLGLNTGGGDIVGPLVSGLAGGGVLLPVISVIRNIIGR